MQPRAVSASAVIPVIVTAHIMPAVTRPVVHAMIAVATVWMVSAMIAAVVRPSVPVAISNRCADTDSN